MKPEGNMFLFYNFNDFYELEIRFFFAFFILKYHGSTSLLLRTRMVAHFSFSASGLMDSEGVIYGSCLLSFHVKLPFCDIDGSLFCYFQRTGDPLSPSLLFVFLWLHLVSHIISRTALQLD